MLQSKAKYIAESLHNRPRPAAAAGVAGAEAAGQAQASGSRVLHERQIRALRLHWAARMLRALLVALLPLSLLLAAVDLFKHIDFAQGCTSQEPQPGWLLHHWLVSPLADAWCLSVAISVIWSCLRRRWRFSPLRTWQTLLATLLPSATAAPPFYGWIDVPVRALSGGRPELSVSLALWRLLAEPCLATGV